MSLDRIGLATNWNYPDYGGMLQAYASQVAIEKLGYSVEVFDVRDLQTEINRRKLRYFARNIFDSSVVKEKSQVVFTRLREKVDADFSKGKSRRYAAFSSFCEASFNRSERFSSWDEMTQFCERCSCVVVGSDQLWLPSNIVGDYYTLSFVSENVKKISYATSFGVSSLPNHLKGRARDFLDRFTCLSARELSGQRIIKDLTGRDVPLVCDPTLLLDRSDWKGVASSSNIPDRPYVFCYLMGDNPSQRKLIEQIAKRMGLMIVSLPHLDRYIANDIGFSDCELWDVSPADFVSLVENASLVCTDSFHGTIFSTIFEKNFYVFPRFTTKATLSTNTRIDSLLTVLGLEQRFIDGSEGIEEILSREMDRSKIKRNLTQLRRSSMSYLRESIEG